MRAPRRPPRPAGSAPAAAAYTAAFGAALLLLTGISLLSAAPMRLPPVNPMAQ
jgi:hypothetical protein